MQTQSASTGWPTKQATEGRRSSATEITAFSGRDRTRGGVRLAVILENLMNNAGKHSSAGSADHEQSCGSELALFDFDGTLTRKDTYTRLLRFAAGDLRFYTALLALLPAFGGYLVGRVSHSDLKVRILTRLMGGLCVSRYRELATRFAREKIPGLLREDAVARLQWHRRRGDRVIVVSASMREWLQPFCDEFGAELLCTELEIVGSALTGRLAGRNCTGLEKVRRIRRHLDLTQYAAIHAYGNSRADRPMLAIAHYRWYRRFPTGR